MGRILEKRPHPLKQFTLAPDQADSNKKLAMRLLNVAKNN
jgi:hypothetical protein